VSCAIKKDRSILIGQWSRGVELGQQKEASKNLKINSLTPTINGLKAVLTTIKKTKNTPTLLESLC